MSDTSLPKTSLAAVFHAVGKPLTLERFPIPRLRDGAALARIRCATICGSDLHSFYGRRHSPSPSVLGHEMVGEIIDISPTGARDYEGRPLALGDRVTWSMVWSCGECFFCRHGLRPKCERLMKFGHEAITPESALIGGLAEYCQLPERTAIFKIPSNVPDTVASPANCATATVASVCRRAGVMAGQHVVVHGAGMLGLTACAMASASGAASVIILEPAAHRRDLAGKFGATEKLDGALPAEQLRARVLELTAGRGADLGLEFSGDPGAIETGINLLRFGGRFVMAGATFPARPIQLAADQLVRRMIQIIGVYNYEPEDLGAALQFLAEQSEKFPFHDLIGKVFPLAEVNAAFDFAERERPPRVAIFPDATVHPIKF